MYLLTYLTLFAQVHVQLSEYKVNMILQVK